MAAGKQEGKIIKGEKETLESEGHVHYLGGGNSFMVYTYVKLIELCIFDMRHLLYANYISIQMVY